MNRTILPSRCWPCPDREDVEALAQLGQLATAAYISAVSAHCGSGPGEVEAYVGERSAQAAWLLERLS